MYLQVLNFPGLHIRRQVAIDFHNMQCIQSFQQRIGQCPLAGTDFDHVIRSLRCNRMNDFLDYAGIMQEVLPEALPGDVLMGRFHCMPPAVSIARYRLVGSALPVAASSSAVP